MCNRFRLGLPLIALALAFLSSPAGGQEKKEKLPSPKERLSLSGHALPMFGLAFSPDGKTLASASHDNSVKLWDPATGQEQITLKGYPSWITAVAFSPDGKTLASAGAGGFIRLSNVGTGEDRAKLTGHTS